MDFQLLEDAELMALSSTGNHEALGALYDRHSGRVFSLAMVLLGDRKDAEEVTQDVFLSVWRHSKGFDPLKARFSTWVTHVAHNRAVDELRKRRRRSKETPLADEPAESHPALQDATPLDAEMESKRIWKLVGGLPEEYRTVVYLSYYQGYTHQEIASILDRPLGTVKTHMRAALKRLRESMIARARETR